MTTRERRAAIRAEAVKLAAEVREIAAMAGTAHSDSDLWRAIGRASFTAETIERLAAATLRSAA